MPHWWFNQNQNIDYRLKRIKDKVKLSLMSSWNEEIRQEMITCLQITSLGNKNRKNNMEKSYLNLDKF